MVDASCEAAGDEALRRRGLTHVNAHESRRISMKRMNDIVLDPLLSEAIEAGYPVTLMPRSHALDR
ncbi:hypothetical protein JJB11_06050 [Ramlibacter ginsenosidimutans]|uniref:Uncharacterized protein n=1 Tax=Ramlibacter ginsenosidimutans TaxID=502333 RepID=A0A934TRD3_9BURK|nr:hypothetical protein [Ramlibacter ginsenosidimutans]MBK6005650.1 hypothetical protein [Ramlibacter ginsenosidimutans]